MPIYSLYKVLWDSLTGQINYTVNDPIPYGYAEKALFQCKSKYPLYRMARHGLMVAETYYHAIDNSQAFLGIIGSFNQYAIDAWGLGDEILANENIFYQSGAIDTPLGQLPPCQSGGGYIYTTEYENDLGNESWYFIISSRGLPSMMYVTRRNTAGEYQWEVYRSRHVFWQTGFSPIDANLWLVVAAKEYTSVPMPGKTFYDRGQACYLMDGNIQKPISFGLPVPEKNDIPCNDIEDGTGICECVHDATGSLWKIAELLKASLKKNYTDFGAAFFFLQPNNVAYNYCPVSEPAYYNTAQPRANFYPRSGETPAIVKWLYEWTQSNDYAPPQFSCDTPYSSHYWDVTDSGCACNNAYHFRFKVLDWVDDIEGSAYQKVQVEAMPINPKLPMLVFVCETRVSGVDEKPYNFTWAFFKAKHNGVGNEVLNTYQYGNESQLGSMSWYFFPEIIPAGLDSPFWQRTEYNWENCVTVEYNNTAASAPIKLMFDLVDSGADEIPISASRWQSSCCDSTDSSFVPVLRFFRNCQAPVPPMEECECCDEPFTYFADDKLQVFFSLDILECNERARLLQEPELFFVSLKLFNENEEPCLTGNLTLGLDTVNGYITLCGDNAAVLTVPKFSSDWPRGKYRILICLRSSLETFGYSVIAFSELIEYRSELTTAMGDWCVYKEDNVSIRWKSKNDALGFAYNALYKKGGYENLPQWVVDTLRDQALVSGGTQDDELRGWQYARLPLFLFNQQAENERTQYVNQKGQIELLSSKTSFTYDLESNPASEYRRKVYEIILSHPNVEIDVKNNGKYEPFTLVSRKDSAYSYGSCLQIASFKVKNNGCINNFDGCA